jgi:hypothetical protein
MATSDPGQRESGGTWASREAPGEWRRSAAARAQFFGWATERMLDLAKRIGNIKRHSQKSPLPPTRLAGGSCRPHPRYSADNGSVKGLSEGFPEAL